MIPPLLHARNFRTYWLGQTVSMFGDQITLFAIPVTGVLLLHAGPAQMGLLTAAGMLPSLLFALHAGSLVDRRGHRRRTMIGCDLARALLVTTIPLAYAFGALGMGQLYLVAFVAGTLDTFFSVASVTLFVGVVESEQFVEGQSLLSGSRAFTAILGQGLAGLLIAVLTAAGAILVDAATFLVSAFFLGRISPPEPDPEPAGPGRVVAGLRFIRESRPIRAALAATTTVNYFTYAFTAIFILFATRHLHVRPAVLGLVLGAGGFGALLGSVVTTPVSRRIGTGATFALGCLAFPVPLLLVPLAGGPHWLVLLMLFGAEFGSGLGVMLLDISIGAIFARDIPVELRSRVSGAYRMVNYGIRPLGAVTGGALGAALGLTPTLWICVAGASACALWLVGTPEYRVVEPSKSTSTAG